MAEAGEALLVEGREGRVVLLGLWRVGGHDAWRQGGVLEV